MLRNYSSNQSWREFQRELQFKGKKPKRRPRMLFILLGVILAAALYYGAFRSDGPRKTLFSIAKKTLINRDKIPTDKVVEPPETTGLSRLEIRSILKERNLINSRENRFTATTSKGEVTVNLGLDMPLQHYLLAELDHLKTLDRGKPQCIAMVGLDPDTGRIAAFAGFDLSDPKANPCIRAEFPAASIFKIVTASAAIEKLNYTPDTQLYFNGGKYTLYKRQIKEKRNRYTTRVTLARAFAESINPVFGKLGSLKLGGEILAHYAGAFGFDKEFDSDLLFSSGTLVISDNSYQWAEVGCGFNKTTRISPLFSAMISGTILNQGVVPTPWLVEDVINARGETIYKPDTRNGSRAIKPETAGSIMKMMNRTIAAGTARSSFRRASRDTVLSHLNLGGKTGSLYNNDHTIKYDWFTGFAMDRQNGKKLAVAVLVGHRKYIGTRASKFARIMFTEYFKNHLTLK